MSEEPLHGSWWRVVRDTCDEPPADGCRYPFCKCEYIRGWEESDDGLSVEETDYMEEAAYRALNTPSSPAPSQPAGHYVTASGKMGLLKCMDCRDDRSATSAKLCRFCYLRRAAVKRFHEDRRRNLDITAAHAAN